MCSTTAATFLATRRALTKKVWPGVWSNTVCGHPAPGESFEDAIDRRLEHELGMTARDVQVVLPDHLYRAPPFAGIVEYEFCPVFVARQASAPEPNPIEVGACAWIDWDEFVRRALRGHVRRVLVVVQEPAARAAGTPARRALRQAPDGAGGG